jgi:hypothetical protein
LPKHIVEKLDKEFWYDRGRKNEVWFIWRRTSY